MIRRTTAILGAGAVLDFDFGGQPKPTTKYITETVVEQKIQGYEGIDSDLIKHVYNLILDASRSEYFKMHPEDRHYKPDINFEQLFEVIETLYSYSGTWKHEHYPFSLISALVNSDLDYYSVDYNRSMVAIIKTIVEIVDSYDEHFRTCKQNDWYKRFWKSFSGKVDVFNLNYDTTVENSLDVYNDGFVDAYPGYQRFEPEILWNADDDTATVNHLHGCILYGDPNPEPLQFPYSHHDLYKFYSAKDAIEILGRRFFLPHNQVGDSIFYSPIITGLKKTDKICYMPHNFYHANLTKKIIENPSLLICGYSFGDLYVDQLLQRHKLIHGKNERVLLVDKWDDVYDTDSLFKRIKENVNSGLREFVLRIIECTYEVMPDTFKQFNQVADGCWESPNRILWIYTKGFKLAVEDHKEEVMSFLQVSN